MLERYLLTMSNADNTPLDGDRELAGPGSETLDEYRRRLGGDQPAETLPTITYHGPCTSGAYDAGDVFERFLEAKYGC